jgi:murein DD-endopeptidase MepM/ murein hydrolase activator NlpD
VEALAYDVTMGDWRTHSGLDIAAAAGTKVVAAASGTVSSVYEDDLLGTTVVIDHGKGLISVYANLAAVPSVKTGGKVSTGTVIGTVGTTAPAESGLAPHLHFALFKNDNAVNPLDYLPER